MLTTFILEMFRKFVLCSKSFLFTEIGQKWPMANCSVFQVLHITRNLTVWLRKLQMNKKFIACITSVPKRSTIWHHWFTYVVHLSMPNGKVDKSTCTLNRHSIMTKTVDPTTVLKKLIQQQ